MMPTLARPGDVAPGQLGPISRAPCARTISTAATMSSAGMPSVMQKIVPIPAEAASITASGAPAAGTKISDVFAPVSRTASATVSKTGTVPSSAVCPPLPGRHARDHVRPVGGRRAGVEFALATGDPLDDEARLTAHEDAHAVAPRDAATAFAAASSRLAAVSKRASVRSVAASAALVPTIRTTIGTSRVCWARASMSPGRPRRRG